MQLLRPGGRFIATVPLRSPTQQFFPAFLHISSEFLGCSSEINQINQISIQISVFFLGEILVEASPKTNFFPMETPWPGTLLRGPGGLLREGFLHGQQDGLGVAIHWGTPKWSVYKRKIFLKLMIEGNPHFGKPPFTNI